MAMENEPIMNPLKMYFLLKMGIFHIFDYRLKSQCCSDVLQKEILDGATLSNLRLNHFRPMYVFRCVLFQH